jgi:hypothetical protein
MPEHLVNANFLSNLLVLNLRPLNDLHGYLLLALQLHSQLHLAVGAFT